MRERTIGILGGMGPEATLDLYREIIRLTPAKKDQDHIPVLIFSNPRIPDRTGAILGEGADPVPELIRTAVALERSGAGILAIPCNAAHHFLPAIQASVKIPILDMIRQTCLFLEAELPLVRTVGLLAATGTILSGVYQNGCARSGLKLLVPVPSDQVRVHGAIFEVKSGKYSCGTRETFHSIGDGLVSRGAEAVILGCTEIPLAFDPERVNYPCVNPTRVLAQAAVAWALGKKG